MTERRLNNMRYWGLLAGKLGVSAAISYGLLALINALWSPQIYLIKYGWKTSRFGFDLAYTLVVGVWFLISVGLLYLCIWDQRYRCRVCLRRLRMPITTGSWGRMLLVGRPRIAVVAIDLPIQDNRWCAGRLRLAGHFQFLGANRQPFVALTDTSAEQHRNKSYEDDRYRSKTARMHDEPPC